MASTDLMIPDVVETDKIVVLPAQAEPEFSGYRGAGTLIVTSEEQARLGEKLADDAHDILPTGEVYVSQVHYRRILNGTFGPGQWAMVPRGAFVKETKGRDDDSNNKKTKQFVYREFAMVVRGHFVAEATGEQEYFEDSMTYATACEAVKSNALTRCCKDLGIASECWDKRFCETFKAQYCVQVWRKDVKKPEWRRRDSTPFWNEAGLVAKRETVAPQGKEAPRGGLVSGSPNSGGAPAGENPAAPTTTDEFVPVATPSQVERMWTLARKRWPKRVEVETNIRGILKDVAGVESSRDIPTSKYEAVIRAITGEAEPEKDEF